MNTLTKVLAPAALVLAAFGAQAGEVTPGDIGASPVQRGSATVRVSTLPAAASGEVLAQDIGAQPVVKAPAQRAEGTATRTAQRVQPTTSFYNVGA